MKHATHGAKEQGWVKHGYRNATTDLGRSR
jgi:hypothetical protein